MTTPDQKPKETPEAFLSRWSQRKQQSREEAQAPKPPAVQPAEAPPVLPPVDQLNADSDYRGFMHPKVDDALRRTALKKLFSDPHFNVMDGLDTYIEDYSISDPLPAAMLKELKQAQNILAWARETEEEAAVRRRGLPVIEPEPAAAEAAKAPEQVAAEVPASSTAVPEVESAEQKVAAPASGEETPDDSAQNA